MSQKIETLRAFVEAFNRRDFDDLARYLHPDGSKAFASRPRRVQPLG